MSSAVENHFADAKGGRQERIAFTLGKSSHTGRLAHFHHSKVSIGDPSVTRVDLSAQRIVRFAFHPRSAKRIVNDLCSSLAAVGHRHDGDLCIPQNVAQSERNLLCNFASLSEPSNLSGAIRIFIVARASRFESGVQAGGMRYFKLRSKISPASCGFALPLDSLITCP